MLDRKIARRSVLKGALAGLAAIPVVGVISDANAAGVALDPNDAQAKALGYVTDSSKVDAKANPMHKPEQKCSNCAQFKGAATDATGMCNIFAGKMVAAGGWCKAYAKKAG
jgi:hypothetical protein